MALGSRWRAALALLVLSAPVLAVEKSVPALPSGVLPVPSLVGDLISRAASLSQTAQIPEVPAAASMHQGIPALELPAAPVLEPKVAAFLSRVQQGVRVAGEPQLPAASLRPEIKAEDAPKVLAAASAALENLSEQQIRDLPAAALAQLAGRMWDAAGVMKSAVGPGDAFSPDNFDHAEGAAEIRKLQLLNDELASGRIGLEDLKSMGLIRDGKPVVTRGDGGGSGADQVMPFKELLLPAARTGLYVPTKAGPLKDYQGLMVVMPGIGADVSTAKTVLDVALTFSKAKKDPVLDNVNGKRVRLLSFPLDATVNGMGKDSPFAFGSAEGSVAVLRHAVLVLRLMYPGKPVFVAGRSQGGLIALEYAGLHDEAVGVLALNPSHPDPAVVADTVRTHEIEPQKILGSQSFTLDPKAWTAYKVFTPGYRALERSSKAKVLLMLGKNDRSYPQPFYLDSYRGYAERQSGDRSIKVVDVHADVSHNLWNRSEESIYRDTIRAMAEFFLSLLPKNP